MLVGLLLLLALLGYLAQQLLGTPLWPALLGAWGAAALSWWRVDSAMRRLASGLLIAGGLLLALAWQRGLDPGGLAALTINMPIVSLFIGISFLGLVAPQVRRASAAEGAAEGAGETPNLASSPAPAGPTPTAGDLRALWRTMAQVHLIGAVINLSMVTIVADRLSAQAPLTRGQTTALVRAYCAAAFWSPFFVAAAVAITYAPGARLSISLPLGVIAAMLALAFTAWEVRRLPQETFVAYEPDRLTLLLSLSLLAAVLLVKYLVPTLGIVLIVAALSPLFALALMPHANRGVQLADMLRRRLPDASAQIILFLAAGVFAQGAALALPLLVDLQALPVAHWPGWLFGVLYSLCIALIIVGAYLAIHPIVSIAALASVLAPLQPDPSLMAVAILAGWAVGTAAAPLSGINLLMIGKYQVRARDVLRWHPWYAVRMWVVVSLLLVGMAWWQD